MVKSRKYRKKMRGGFYSPTTNTSNPGTSNTSNSIMGFFNDAWKKTKETSQSMLSSMNKPITTTTSAYPSNNTNTYPNNNTNTYTSTITGGKTTRRKRGGYHTTGAYTGAPVNHIKMAKPTYWIKGGRTQNKKRRNNKSKKSRTRSRR